MEAKGGGAFSYERGTPVHSRFEFLYILCFEVFYSFSESVASPSPEQLCFSEGPLSERCSGRGSIFHVSLMKTALAIHVV